MDFHSLARRELQALCKKNKIPANMTNLAMADALSALTNVEGIEDIGKSFPETPITCRKTSSRKPTKPQADHTENEPESSLPQSRTRRAPRRIIQEEEEESKESKGATEIAPLTEIPKTPAARAGRKRVTGTSVSKKTDTQIKEKEIPVVPRAYSTRRSTRLQQSEPKISESVPKSVGRRNEAVKIEMVSGEETDTLEKESKSEVIDEVPKNEGATVKVLSANEEDMVSEDVNSEEFSANVISAEVPSTEIVHVSDECKEEFTVEVSNGDQDVTSEEISTTVIPAEESNQNIAHVLDASPLVEKSPIQEDSMMNSLPSAEDNQCMKDVDQCKEEFAVEGSNCDQGVTSEEFSANVIAAVESNKNIAHVLDASPLLENAPILEDSMMNSLPSAEDDQCMKDVDQAIENNEEDKKLVFEDELCEVKVTEVQDIILDESSLVEETQNLEDSNGECLMNSLPSDQDQANEMNEDEFYDIKVTAVNSEILDFGSFKVSFDEVINDVDEQQEQESVIVSPPSKVSSDIHNEFENSVADDGLENQMVKLENSDTVADIDAEKLQMVSNATSCESEDLDSEKFSRIANVDVAEFDLTADTNAILDKEVQWSSDSEASDAESELSDADSELSDADVVEEVSDVEEIIHFSSSATDITLSEITVLTPAKLTAPEIRVTPRKSSTKKKASTTPTIKVLEDNLEDNESDKVSLKSSSKVLTVVAEEKENNKNMKVAKNTENMSLRQLRKTLKALNITDEKSNTTTTTVENNNKIIIKDQFEKKRLALQPLNKMVE